MEIEQLDHFTIKVSDLDASTRFYTDVVGLRNGARPDFAFGGAWLYCGDHPLVHLIDRARQALGLAKGKSGLQRGMGANLDHVAFRASIVGNASTADRHAGIFRRANRARAGPSPTFS